MMPHMMTAVRVKEDEVTLGFSSHEEHMPSCPKSSNESHRFGRDSDVPQQHRTFAAPDIRLVQKSRSAASCPAKLSANPR